MDKIIYNIASYKRADTLIKTIQSIYNQCDIINVALNDYDEIPVELYDKKINLFISDNDKGDAYKFYKLTSSEGYFFTVDDDLIYPENYSEYMISKIEQYNRKNIITIHGRSFKNFPIKGYYNGKEANVYHFKNTINEDTPVQFGGTGVMAFHTDLFKVGMDAFEYPNMADIWIGKYAKENNITILCAKHKSKFVIQQQYEESIYDSDVKKDDLQTILVNQSYNNKDLTIIIPTFKNVEYIDECLNSVINSSLNYNVEILVGIDGCEETLNYVLSKKFPNIIKFYYFFKNEGPYLIKNTLSKISNSDYILFFDSDDVSLDIMVPTIIINKKNYKLIKPKYKNFGDKSYGGKSTDFGEGVFGIKKDIFISMNGFEPWLCAADSDFMSRFYKSGENFLLHTKDILFNRRLHDKGLTSRKETGMSSKLRRDYIKLGNQKTGNRNPKFFSVRDYKQVLVQSNGDNDKIVKELLNQKIEVITEETKRRNEVLNTISKIQLKTTKKTPIDYDKINKVNNLKGVYNPKEHVKTSIVQKPKESPLILKEDSMAKLKREMFQTKPKRKGGSPNIFGNSQRRKGGFSI